MKKTRRLSAILLAIIMTISVCLPTNANESILQEASSKIQSDLRGILLSSEKNDEIPVDIWLYEPFTTEQLEKEIDSKIGLNKEKINQSEERTMSAKKVDEYIETERTLYSEKMNALYKDFLKDYSKISALNEKRNGKRLFLSKYSPLISAELTPAEIKQLAKDERVQSIYYSPDVEVIPTTNISFPLIKANVVRDTIGYTGSGMKIGMIEAFGVPDKNKSIFTAANIVYDPHITNPTTDIHADIVAAIMVAKATSVDDIIYEGIVPDAKLYATYINTNDSVDWRERAEWLLTEGVHVINMSFSFGKDTEGVYHSEDAWVDHIAVNHGVHVVISAGNDGGYIDSPGMAYNAITVGAIDDMNSANQEDDMIAYYSNYQEVPSLTNKPDLVAPGTNISSVLGTYTGTSVSAPHVAAVITQLCQWHTTLRTKQAAMKAILTASMNHSEHVYTPKNETKYDQYGAGVINAQEALYTINHVNYTSPTFSKTDPQGTSHYYDFTVTTSGLKKRVSLSWLKQNSISGTHATSYPANVDLTNLSLSIYDPNGNFVVFSVSPVNNTEIVEFTPNVIGDYQMVVTLTSAPTTTTYYALAWYY